MKRFCLLLIVSLSVLMLYLGCDGEGESGDGTEPEPTPIASPEPTPIATPEPTPEPGGGFDCDFVPDETGEFFTENICTELADAFGCEDFNFQGGICEVFGCEDCLCSSTSKIIEGSNGVACAIYGALNSCYIGFHETNECHFFACQQEFPCGPFDMRIP